MTPMRTTPATAPAPIPGPPPRVLVIEARFYEHIADELLAGARARLAQADADIDVVTVPGALEIPAVIALAVRAAREVQGFRHYDGFVVLGTVIRGETTHYDVVANESNRAVMDLATGEGLAIGNGILTVESEEQALARARRSDMDKGGAAASACLAMIALQRKWGLRPALVASHAATGGLDRDMLRRLDNPLRPTLPAGNDQ